MIYRKEIDGLRALAVIPVMLFHAGFKIFEGGFVGVDIFFVISGYLITYIIIDQLSSNKFSLKKFYERRAKRILPALFLVMIASFPFAYIIMMPFQMIDFAESILSTTFFASNFLFLFESGYFDGPSELKPLLHTWSLAVEEQFYLFYPLFLIFFWKKGKFFIINTIFLMFCFSFILSEYLSIYQPSFNFFMLPTRAWELFVGAFISFFLFDRYGSNVPPKYKYSNILSLVGAMLVLFSIFYIDSSTRFPSSITLLPVIGTAFLILFAVKGTALYYIFSQKYIVFLGLLSYSLYLWHQPILVFGRMILGENLSTAINLLLLLLSSIISYFSWKFFEVPIRKSSFNQTTIFNAVFISMAISVALFLIVDRSQGFYKQKGLYNEQYILTDQDLATYVRSRQESIENVPFPNNDKPNVLIIGDSFSQDIVNIIFESNYELNFNISSFYLRHRCKNLSIDKEILNELINPNDRDKCSSLMHYNSPVVQKRMQSADQIWLVSDWEKEDLPFIEQSINNIVELSKAKVLIFETKAFYKPRNYFFNFDKEEVINFKYNYDNDIYYINNYLKQFNSISLMDKYCKDRKCLASDNQGYLITYDNSHLTKEGAIFLSRKFNFNNMVITNNK